MPWNELKGLRRRCRKCLRQSCFHVVEIHLDLNFPESSFHKSMCLCKFAWCVATWFACGLQLPKILLGTTSSVYGHDSASTPSLMAPFVLLPLLTSATLRGQGPK